MAPVPPPSNLEIEGGKITSCRFTTAAGNTDGLARLAVGQDAREVMNRLRGVQCRGGTSCPDQLSRAIEIYLDQQQHK